MLVAGFLLIEKKGLVGLALVYVILIILRLFLDHFHYCTVNLVTAKVEGIVGIDIIPDPQDAFTVVVHYF